MAIMQIKIDLEGVTPILMHNERLANPLEPIVKEIKRFTGKKTKTDDDWENIRHLEWTGSLYLRNGEIAMPNRCVRACLRSAARANRLGRDIERALSFSDEWGVFDYDGPRDLEQLYASGKYVDASGVVIKNIRNVRFRPVFEKWAVHSVGFLQSDLMDIQTLRDIAERAGAVEGLCDNRTNGRGRFIATVNLL